MLYLLFTQNINICMITHYNCLKKIWLKSIAINNKMTIFAN